MGARNLSSSLRILDREVVKIFGKCVGNTTSNPTGVAGAGVAGVTRSGVGLYTITLQDKWNTFLGAKFTVIDSSALEHYEITVSSETVASTKTVNLTIWGAATGVAPVKLDLGTDVTLRFEIDLSNTGQTPSSR